MPTKHVSAFGRGACAAAGAAQCNAFTPARLSKRPWPPAPLAPGTSPPHFIGAGTGLGSTTRLHTGVGISFTQKPLLVSSIWLRISYKHVLLGLSHVPPFLSLSSCNLLHCAPSLCPTHPCNLRHCSPPSLPRHQGCGLLQQCLDELAAKYPSTKFLRIVSTDAIPHYPDANLPTLLLYHDTHASEGVERQRAGFRKVAVRSVSLSVRMPTLQLYRDTQLCTRWR